jgi:hypothetical protein
MTMSIAVRLGAACLAVAIVPPLGAMSISALDAAPASTLAGEFAFAFVVGSHGANGISAARPASPPAVRGGLVEGQVLSGISIVDALATAPPAGQVPAGSAFSDAELIAHVQDLGTGEVMATVVARCPTLDFETNAGSPFEQQVVCGGVRYSYAGTTHGIVVSRGTETAVSLPLSPGLYTVNGVPFLVEQ